MPLLILIRLTTTQSKSAVVRASTSTTTADGEVYEEDGGRIKLFSVGPLMHIFNYDYRYPQNTTNTHDPNP